MLLEILAGIIIFIFLTWIICWILFFVLEILEKLFPGSKYIHKWDVSNQLRIWKNSGSPEDFESWSKKWRNKNLNFEEKQEHEQNLQQISKQINHTGY